MRNKTEILKERKGKREKGKGGRRERERKKDRKWEIY